MLYRVDRLFIMLVCLVLVVGSFKLHREVTTPFPSLPKKQVFSHHIVAVTLPLLMNVNNKSQLAAIIGHELAHIQLGHTISAKHDMVDEYNSDITSIYYMKKAGYNICEAKLFWESMGDKYLSLKPSSHPNHQTRAYYMTFPECRDYVSKREDVTLVDAKEVFNNLNKHVAGIARYKTKFKIIFLSTDINAYASTIMKDKK